MTNGRLLYIVGTPRRKKKIVHQTAATDDKKLQSTLKKLAVNNIPGIEEVNLIKNDGTVIHFNNPKTQASLASNVFAITGHGEQKQVHHLAPLFPFLHLNYNLKSIQNYPKLLPSVYPIVLEREEV
jgi:hypothetical protein